MSTGASGANTSMFSRISCHAFQFAFAPFPGAFEPGPGIVLPQASPLHSGQALQLRIVFRAFSRTSA